MKRKYLIVMIISIIALLSGLQAFAENYLELSYPAKTNKINSPDTYFIGNTAPGSIVTINNVPVSLHEKGLFVKVIPLDYGCNTFRVKSVKNDSVAEKMVTVNVPYPEMSLPERPMQIAATTISPSGTNIYSPGDIVNVKFKASPGANASFSLGKNVVSMTELPPQIDTVKMLVLGEIYGIFPKPVSGIYNGVYQVRPSDNFNNTPLKVHLSDGKGNCKTYLASTQVTSWNPDANPKVAEITAEKATIRTGPGDARLTPLPQGVKIHLTGYENGYYRFRMGPLMEGYIPQNQIKVLPQGTPVPYSEIRSLDIKKSATSTIINIPMTTKLPFSVDQSVDQSKLFLYLYGAKADTDIIKYDASDKYISQVKWSQPYKNVYVLDVLFKKPQQWGYEVYYTGFESKGTLNLVLKIKSPPEVDTRAPLKDKVIAIDPGHGGSELGSMGFGLIPEKDINLQISYMLANLLEKEGARPILIRKDDSYMGIYDRPDAAAVSNADILISIHNNAIPDGRDPLIEHGSSSYYYHPMAFPLAEKIHKRLLSQLNLPDFGLYYDNLALPREHRFPTVLIEIAFMIHPDEYLLLTNSDFQQKSAGAILKGVSDFFLETR